jgi:hypothetical protein
VGGCTSGAGGRGSADGRGGELDVRPTRFVALDPNNYVFGIEFQGRGKGSGIEVDRRFFRIVEPQLRSGAGVAKRSSSGGVPAGAPPGIYRADGARSGAECL